MARPAKKGSTITGSTETDSSLYLASDDTETDHPLYLASVDEDRKVLDMMSGEDDEDVSVFGASRKSSLYRNTKNDHDITIGRMSVLLDESEFDYVPPREVDFTEDDGEQLKGDEIDTMPPMFAPPTTSDDSFPLLKAALQKFQAAESPGRIARVDTEETYPDFVSDKAVAEIARRLDELQAQLDDHIDDPYAHPHTHRGNKMFSARRDDVLGAAEAVSNLKAARTADEAVDAMPQVPLDLPDFADGKVKCWRDGDMIVVSIRFGTVDGDPRYATMAAKPKVNADEVARWALASGADPTTVFGALPDLTAVATGKRLVRDIAGAALRARGHHEVLGMDNKPVLLASKSTEGAAPLAAVMWVQQLADNGDAQAQLEMAKLNRAALTPSGQQIAAPLINEAQNRLAAARSKKAEILGARAKQHQLGSGQSLWSKITGWLR